MGDVEKALTELPSGERTPGPGASADGSAGRPAEATRTGQSALEQTSHWSQAAEADTYDFLAAAQAADELGRLGGYRVLRVLGEGGMGVVFEAEDPLLHRRVALKAIKPSVAASADARQRFLREAQTVASVEHENIVTILQVGDDRGIPFITMPLLRGQTLADRMARPGDQPLPLGDILRISREIAAGLAAAHQQGLIHRDVKPANIWLEAKTGRVKLLDFGLARAADEDQHLTQTGAVLGTPAYMSPEQARGESVDDGTDLFSLGCVLYHMVTGRRPFHAASAVGTLLAVATIEPTAPAAVNACVPEALDRLIRELMAKQRTARPASAEQVVERLLAIERVAAAGMSEECLPRPSHQTLSGCESGVPETIFTKAGLPDSQRIGSPPVRRRMLILAVAASAAALFVAAAVTFMRRGDVPQRDEQTAPALPAVETGKAVGAARDSHKRDAYATKDEIDWSPGADEGYLPGIVPRPAKLPGIGRWQLATRVPRGGTIAFNALAFSPDSRWVATISNDGHVRLYDAATRGLRRILMGHAGAAQAIAWSPNADVFATSGTDNKIRLWSVRQAKRAAVLRGHTAEVTALAWSRGGRLASGAGWGDPSVCIWNVEGQQEANVPYGAAVTCVAWSPDRRRLAVGGIGRGVLLSTAGGKQERTLDDGMSVRCLAFSPDGGLLASGSADGALHVWNAADWSLLPALNIESGSRIAGLAFNHDGHLLAIHNEDRRTYVYDTSSGARRELTRFSGGLGYGMVWSHDDQLLAVADNHGNFDFYDHELAPVEPLVLGLSARDPVLSATGIFAATVSADRKGFLRIVERADRRNQSYSGPTPAYSNWSSDGKLLAATHFVPADHHSVFDASTGKPVASWPAPAGSQYNCLSPDGKRLATGGTDKGVSIWSLEGKRLAQSRVLPGGITAFAWHPDGRQLAAALNPPGPNAMLNLFDVADGFPLKQVSSVPLSCPSCYDLAWDRRGERLFAATREGAFTARLSAPNHWEAIPLGNVRNCTSWSIVESPDGRSVATGWGDGTCRLFSLDGKPGHVLRGHAACVSDVVFTDEGKHILSVSEDCTMIKWDAATGKPLQATLILPDDQLIAYGPGGEVLKATPQAEEELLYVIEEPSGEQGIHTPAEFRARLQGTNQSR